MSLVQRFFTGFYVVLRSQPGTYVKGRYQPGPQEEIKICGSMQPSSARELKLPEEGSRIKQYFKFYTDEPVCVGSPRTLADSDYVIINGESYRAMGITSWQNTDLDYHMTALWREPQQDGDGKGGA